MTNRNEFVRRQLALAEFGEFVLDHDDLQPILQEACRLIAEALQVDLAKVLEIQAQNDSALVRAGVGWAQGIVGHERVPLSQASSESYALEQGEPVICRDINDETRFEFPQFLKTHGVVAMVNVPIFLPGRTPYGLIQVDARSPREFDEEDIAYLKTYAMTLGPVIDRLRKLGALQQSDERFQFIVENARDYAIVLSDPQDLVTDWLAGSTAIFGWRDDEIIGQPTSVLFSDEDCASGIPQSQAERARRGIATADVRWHPRKDGGRVCIDSHTMALWGADGALRGYAKIAQDVTARTHGEERQAVLLAELQHRVRNVLALVRAVASRTFANAETIEDAAAQFSGRIDAMARTQALLTRAAGVGVGLEDLIREELVAQAADQSVIVVGGPEVSLAPKAAEVLTLAVHELATNATKYGALGQDAGRLSVSWRQETEDGQPWLRLFWNETNVAVASAAPRRQGFGVELVTRRVPYELKGRANMELRPGGLECLIEFPLVRGESVLATTGPE